MLFVEKCVFWCHTGHERAVYWVGRRQTGLPKQHIGQPPLPAVSAGGKDVLPYNMHVSQALQCRSLSRSQHLCQPGGYFDSWVSTVDTKVKLVTSGPVQAESCVEDNERLNIWGAGIRKIDMPYAYDNWECVRVLSIDYCWHSSFVDKNYVFCIKRFYPASFVNGPSYCHNRLDMTCFTFIVLFAISWQTASTKLIILFTY